jgi:hypothetical protein
LRPESMTGETDDDWDNTPEEIAKWLKWYQSLQPLLFTEEERRTLEDYQMRRTVSPGLERKTQKLTSGQNVHIHILWMVIWQIPLFSPVAGVPVRVCAGQAGR